MAPRAINVRLAYNLQEIGLTELIGINERVDQNKFSDEVGVTLPETLSGEILMVTLVTTESGSGQVLVPSGKLNIFDADPVVTLNDAALTTAARRALIGTISVETTDWSSDANGASANLKVQPIPFHALSALYFVFRLTSATSFNDAAGDDEQLEFNAWYRRDS